MKRKNGNMHCHIHSLFVLLTLLLAFAFCISSSAADGSDATRSAKSVNLICPTPVMAKGYVSKNEVGIQFSWRMVDGATRYECEAGGSSTDKILPDGFFFNQTTKNTYIRVPISKNYDFSFRVRARATVNGRHIYSPWAKIILHDRKVNSLIDKELKDYIPEKPASLSYMISPERDGRRIFFSWDKATGAEGYQYSCMLTDQNGEKHTKMFRTEKTAASLFISKGTSISFKVRSFRTVKKQELYSKWATKRLNAVQMENVSRYEDIYINPSTWNADYILSDAQLRRIAGRLPVKILNAFKKYNFKVIVSPGMSESGKFDEMGGIIRIRDLHSPEIYHEMGLFLAFASLYPVSSDDYEAIIREETDNYWWSRPDLIRKNSSEYFAESLKEYAFHPAAFEKVCPKSVQAVKQAIKDLSSEDSEIMMALYGHIPFPD
ncbi:MAG: hypothetical protein IKE03_05480 [Blautia sp.]|nr:hypothetical protein [Blautia sp.]